MDLTKRQLLERLHHLLVASHQPLGQVVEVVSEEDAAKMDVYPCGHTGVIAFTGEYVLTGWEHSDLQAAARDAYRHLGERLKRQGFTRHMVYPMNFRSVILTRKLGAVPVGLDADGYVHYILTLEAFEKAAAEHLRREDPENGKKVQTTCSA